MGLRATPARRFWRGWAAFLTALATPCAARAGAWVEGEQTRTITTVGQGARDGLRFTEAETFVESPWGEGQSLVGKARTETYGPRQIDEAEIGAKFRIDRFAGAHGAAALQVGAFTRSEAPPGCAPLGLELRGLVARAAADGRAFANLELAGRYQSGQCASARFEATLGYRPKERWLGLAQGFVHQDFRYEPVLKTQVSIVRFSRGGRGLQLGARAQLEQGEFIAPTLILGYWSSKRSRPWTS